MTKKRIVLTYPTDLVSQPITYHLVKDYDLKFNIMRGVITPREEGLLVLEIEGKKKDMENGISYLKGLGINIESLAHDIKWHEARCTHCTACIPACPSHAMHVDRETMEVGFNKTLCIACELCIPVCPFKALEIEFQQ
ncbi:MAG: 4Fe-4S dicluster domain-containing protein [Deltaproteobacteria bacterium]|nr:4Fe-4S dicluster domain-containing protein [Deltaproteobacteria bacterium]